MMPELVDILIVGGGPAGTAAAFRAKELGLTAVVIDYDDLMKRIRDYAKDKFILPDFGGGDKMQFPKGGELISKLTFGPIDKDDMCAQWKELYERYQVPVHIGVELTGLEALEDGTCRVQAWNHGTKSDQNFLAKHVVIAFGRGVPRRFDIPGNVDGIAFRLSDPANYLGGPVCVIGGGTSAAEAVISISNEKTKAKDSTAVYWSYRGENMPKVSKALADDFFNAYVGNGNVRYLPRSDAVGVVTAEDHNAYLCIRTDRKIIPGRPSETTHLEFPKQHCIACIGEDIPEGLLNSMGIFMLAGGRSKRKRPVVTPLHESQQSNVYLIGDLLSPVYLEAESFDHDPSRFREIKRRGNIKSALRDGVFVVEAIAQKLAGKSTVHVQVDFEPESVASGLPTTATLDQLAQSELQALAKAQAPAAGDEEPVKLVRILETGIEEEEFPVASHGVTTIGREGCDINFSEDLTMSDRHASISREQGGFLLRDEGSVSGVYLKAAPGKSIEIGADAVVKASRQWLVFESSGGEHSFAHFDANGKKVARFTLSEGTVVVGRDSPNITLLPRDSGLSRRHLSISLRQGRLFICDLKSANGTHLKVEKTKIEDGDEIRLGHQWLRFASKSESMPRSDVVFDTAAHRAVRSSTELEPTPRDVAESRPEPPSAAQAIAPPTGLSVTFQNEGKSFSLKKGQSICDLAEQEGIKIEAECHVGLCGSDPIRIISGQENLNPIEEGETQTVEDLCSLEPGTYRLACMSKPTGPVVVEIVEE